MSISEVVRENLQAIVNGQIQVPIAKLIGFHLSSFDYGKATFVLHVNKQHHNPMGIVHGGIFCDIADAAMGVAFETTLEVGEIFGTINFQINFFKGIQQSDLKADGYLVNKGKSIGFLEAKIYDAENDLVATAQSTCKIIRKN